MKNKTYVVGLPAPMPPGCIAHEKTELDRAKASLKTWTMSEEERKALGPAVPWKNKPKSYPKTAGGRTS